MPLSPSNFPVSQCPCLQNGQSVSSLLEQDKTGDGHLCGHTQPCGCRWGFWLIPYLPIQIPGDLQGPVQMQLPPESLVLPTPPPDMCQTPTSYSRHVLFKQQVSFILCSTKRPGRMRNEGSVPRSAQRSTLHTDSKDYPEGLETSPMRPLNTVHTQMFLAESRLPT